MPEKNDKLHFLRYPQLSYLNLKGGLQTCKRAIFVSQRGVVKTKLNFRIPLLFFTFPTSQAHKNRKSRSRSLSKFPLPAPVLSSHSAYHHKKQPNPASRQTYCGPSMKAFYQNALLNFAVLRQRKAALLFNSKVFIFTIQQETNFVNSDVLNRPRRFQHCSPKRQRAF